MNWLRWISMQRRSMSMIQQKIDLPKSSCSAKLVGTVSTDVFTTSNSKSLVFFLRTFNEDQFYDVHKCYVPAHVIKNLPGIPKTGQKLLVSGTPHTTYFIQESGKRGTSIQIIAKLIYLCESSETQNNEPNIFEDITKLGIKDQNRVEVFAEIPFEIVNEEKYDSFNLALHHLTKNSDGKDEKRTDYITVFAYDSALRNIIKNNLNRLDLVRVEGALRYKMCMDNTNKKQYRCYIEAKKITKLTKLQRDAQNKKDAKIVYEKFKEKQTTK